MLICYMPIRNGNETDLKLCLVADKPDELSLPVEIDKLDLTGAAVLRVGPEEACVVLQDPSDNQMIISAMIPARIYLTPNLSQFPGINTQHIKVIKYNDGTYRTYYSRDKVEWVEWIANQERK